MANKELSKAEMMALIAKMQEKINTLEAVKTEEKTEEKPRRNPLLEDGTFQVVCVVNTKNEIILEFYDVNKARHNNIPVHTTLASVQGAVKKAQEKTGLPLNKYVIYTQKGYKIGDKGLVCHLRNAWHRPQIFWHTEITEEKATKKQHDWQGF